LCLNRADFALAARRCTYPDARHEAGALTVTYFARLATEPPPFGMTTTSSQKERSLALPMRWKPYLPESLVCLLAISFQPP